MDVKMYKVGHMFVFVILFFVVILNAVKDLCLNRRPDRDSSLCSE